jgi:hypothetical protein
VTPGQADAAAALTELLAALHPDAHRTPLPRCWRCSALPLDTLAAGTVTCAQLGCGGAS